MSWLLLLGAFAAVVVFFVIARATPKGSRPVARTRLWKVGRWFLLFAAVMMTVAFVAGTTSGA